MAYDEELADRIRDLLAGEPGVIEKKMTAPRMEMRGREMAGWLRVDSADVRTKRELGRRVRLGAS